MKITCDREKLLHAFQAVAAVAPSRSPKPILQNVKIDVADGKATLMATDLEIGIRHDAEGVAAEEPGAAVLPVARFGSILRESSDESFRIESDGQKTLVRGERSQFSLPAENPTDFPSVAEFTEEAYYEAPVRLLKEMIRRTIFATDNESSRYALGGVKLEWEDGKLTAIGTDGRRLAKMEGPVAAVGSPPEIGDATIVPSRSLQLIDRVLLEDDNEVRFVVRQNEILVRTPRAVVSSRLLEGRFPRWRDVFPQRTESARIEMTVGPFFSAVRQAAIVTSDESRGVDFTFGEGVLVLAGQTAEVGESRIELPIGYDGAETVITLDPRFLVDFLKVLGPEKTFTLDLDGPESPAVSKTDDGYGYVIMPLARDR
ncbi:DNA polymerase III subunit beta [Pseudobythopirellula maris]|uniref:Beta sliding clamp n=1 Tax=Pseudobythopirellula maris TaxID=2527991 RepID=A0A5C5ZSA3_9BACT|nr:DNA polymerase III subunit beta [Pseudobythopirellula maris]TWT89083.1 DNA polymerase III subunit beta [Pseudobythopirellula maris]